jgi:hypothetical protein
MNLQTRQLHSRHRVRRLDDHDTPRHHGASPVSWCFAGWIVISDGFSLVAAWFQQLLPTSQPR